jgi:hypothetical protein
MNARRWSLGRAAVFAAGAIGALGLSGCGSSKVTLPTPPNADQTKQIAAAYENPTAVLDTSNIQQTYDDAKAKATQLDLDWLPKIVTDALSQLKQKLNDAALPDTPPDAGGVPNDHVDASSSPSTGRRVTALAEVHRTCPGFDSPSGPADAAANGTLDVTGIVDTGNLNPEVWATATQCMVRVPSASSSSTSDVTVGPHDASVPVLDAAVSILDGGFPGLDASVPVINGTINGTLTFYLLGPLPDTIKDAQVLVIFDGMIGTGGQTAAASFDFELIGTSVKYRVPAGGGEAVVTIGTTIGIQGANAGFTCDLTAGNCQRKNGP